jgi:regulator of sirC expression with transglutaminase-like and TPR domain
MFKKKEVEKIKALFMLLDEPNEMIYEGICESIVFYGIEVNPLLHDFLDNTFDPLVQSRIKILIRRIHLDSLYAELNNWVTLDSKNIFSGYIILTKFIFPDLNVDKILEDLSRLEKEIWLELNSNLTSLEEIKVINKILFETYNFTPATISKVQPDEIALNKLLDSQSGSQKALSVFYAGIAQRLGLPLYMANLPGLMALAYVDNADEKKLLQDRPVLFYVNPITGGAVFTHRDLRYYFKENHMEDKAENYQPCDNIYLLQSIGEEIALSYNLNRDYKKEAEFRSLLKLLY